MLLKTKNGYRWNNDGKEFVGSNAKQEAEQQGKLLEDTKHNKEVQKLILVDNVVTLNVGMKDSSVTFDAIVNEDTGFLTVDAVIARTGIQKYLNSELGEKGTGIVGVYRPVEEVTHPVSMDSFTNAPITNNHPTEMVTAENIDKYGKGSISNVNVVQLEDETGLATKLTITDKNSIQDILNGKKELSVGYTNILVAKDGKYKGEDYKYIQTNIIANHVAIVDAGRCGGICKMQVDSNPILKQGDESMKITINGVEYDVPEAVAKEFEKLNGASKDMEEKEEAMDKLQAKYDTQEGVIKELRKNTTNDSALADAVTEKVTLLKLADSMDKVVCKVTDSTLDIKKVIVDSIDGMKSEGKSEAYLDAVIDMKKTELADKEVRKQNALDSHKKIGDDATKHDKTKTIDVDAIGEQEIK